jgi:hypothetical protein
MYDEVSSSNPPDLPLPAGGRSIKKKKNLNYFLLFSYYYKTNPNKNNLTLTLITVKNNYFGHSKPKP